MPYIVQGRTFQTKDELCNYLVEKTTPLCVKLIYNLRKISLLRRIPVFVWCILLSFGPATIAGAGFIFHGIAYGPREPAFYIWGMIAVGTVPFVAFITGLYFEKLSSQWLNEITNFFSVRSKANTSTELTGLSKWLDRFSAREQFRSCLSSAIISGVFVGLTAIIFDHPHPLTVGSAILGGYIAGISYGSTRHYLNNAPYISRYLLSQKVRVYNLFPGETVKLRILSLYIVQVVIVGLISSTFGYTALTLFVIQAGNNKEIITFWPVILAVIFVWQNGIRALLLGLQPISNYITSKKRQSLAQLQSAISQEYRTCTTSEQSMARFEKLFKLYNDVKTSSSLPVELNSVIRLAAGFVFSLLPIVIERILK